MQVCEAKFYSSKGQVQQCDERYIKSETRELLAAKYKTLTLWNGNGIAANFIISLKIQRKKTHTHTHIYIHFHDFKNVFTIKFQFNN